MIVGGPINTWCNKIIVYLCRINFYFITYSCYYEKRTLFCSLPLQVLKLYFFGSQACQTWPLKFKFNSILLAYKNSLKCQACSILDLNSNYSFSGVRFWSGLYKYRSIFNTYRIQAYKGYHPSKWRDGRINWGPHIERSRLLHAFSYWLFEISWFSKTNCRDH